MESILQALSQFIQQHGIGTLVVIIGLWILFNQTRTRSKIDTTRVEMEKQSDERTNAAYTKLQAVMEERLAEKQRLIERLQAEFDRFQTDKNNEIAGLKREARENREHITSLNQQVEALQRDLEIEKQRRVAAEEKAERMEARQVELENINSRLVNDNAHLVKTNTIKDNRVTELLTENAQLNTRLTALQHENEQLRSQINARVATGENPAVVNGAPPPQLQE